MAGVLVGSLGLQYEHAKLPPAFEPGAPGVEP